MRKSTQKIIHQISDEERALFQLAMQDPKHLPIKPIKKSSIILKKTALQHITKTPTLGITTRTHLPDTVDNEALLFFTRSGVNIQTIKKLKTGKLPFTATLDLHGHTQVTAKNSTEDFLKYAISQQHICVLIIHGKGAKIPILKNMLNALLRTYKDVLAFSSAQSKHGGAGALYLLLNSLSH